MLIGNPRWNFLEDLQIYSWAVWFKLSKWFQRGCVLRHFSQPPQVIVLTQDHMGKYRNIFFSEA
jgi:hypothetical protein